MDKQTVRQTVISAIVFILISLRLLGFLTFVNPVVDLIFVIELIILMFIAWAYFSHYKNNNFSEAAVRHQPKIIREKQILKTVYATGDACEYDKIVGDDIEVKEHCTEKLQKKLQGGE